ncbi:hypothetical protein Y710_16370 [Gordonia sp. QH-12]|uniref:hypothetical protein n=1 Tax=Gordonia TaxID=2053 RepID=UPI00078320FB|nr:MULTISPECIES: hypothetical protein [Gordonia]KXT55924.1 hypothetical protein Y710_16370 [Gordonia sp. QH-12]WFN94176.1 hypothetical protein P5P27_06415 [Gordonia sihwensis]WFN94237.1 hypothetical protein P5P27_06725 [Gordonia sihwensis]
MIAEYYRGEITLRRFRVLAEWALQQVADGKPYTMTDRLLWLLVRRIEENTVVVGKALGNKKLRLPKKHPDYPWSESEDDSRIQIGGRGEHSSDEVMDFLDSK